MVGLSVAFLPSLLLHVLISETSFVHRIRLSKDFYFSDYLDVRNLRFLARKLQIERAVIFWINENLDGVGWY